MQAKKFLILVDLLKKTYCNAKSTETESKIPSIGGLATTTAFMALENKILDVSNLVKKTDYNTKINKIEKKINDHNHDRYSTTPDFNKLTAEKRAAKLAQANLAVKRSDAANFVNKTDFDEKLKNINKKVHQTKQNVC